ncbi:peptide chain release factor 1 [Desulfonatronovibrio magnus]|uniref:peptide chain release factor 1 n=1 Tax=Desulfonatronovibrio magnus TaxID=698827 RepID=UPI0005EB340A|nr:peptide chain release factor 1 [Desulfonatronovibrio magnus]RQD56261.1 MAG: peptide chain release factor 1 [Desulfonatronovibrio sp. MSAO_Bac4]
MQTKLEQLEQEYLQIESDLSDPEIFSDQDNYRRLSKSHADLAPVVHAFREFRDILSQIDENTELLRDKDPEMRQLAEAEDKRLRQERDDLEERLKILLLPKDPMDEKNIILEIRAGTGGEEAALFAADLFRMYSRYAENNSWKVELLSVNETGTGGFKEVIASISGNYVFSRLKYESGTHRVQRVPETESQGRIHTSAVTVAIMPEAEEVDLKIDPNEIRVDVFRSSGPGGQSVNTTDSAVRVTHIPTGLVVSCQDEKSQHKNRAKAMKVLRSRLLSMMEEEQQKEMAATRKAQVGSGDRSERIRTYNFPQGRVSDHRINLTLYNLDAILEGQLDDIVEPLIQNFQAQALKEAKAA